MRGTRYGVVVVATLVLAACLFSGLRAGVVRNPSGLAAPTPGRAPSAATGTSEASPTPSREPVPILMYHAIGKPAGPWPELYVTPTDFAAQMNFLAAHGFHALTLARAVDAWAGRAPMPSRPVVVTFDDGYESTYTVALPVLRKHGQHATLFLQEGLLGKPGALTTDMVKAWIAAGNELGSHTVTHPDLRRVGSARLTDEVAGSRRDLQRLFGVTVRTFAYPSGRYNDAVVQAVRDAGYEAAATTAQGLGRPDQPLVLRRIRVDGSDGLTGFVKKLQAYLGRLDDPVRAPVRATPH